MFLYLFLKKIKIEPKPSSNILLIDNGILDLKKGFDKTLKNIAAVSKDLKRISWKYIKMALNLRISEISILITTCNKVF